jgi:uncharacterized RDD family membrane protein YckC
MKYAGFWARVLAYLIDSILVSVVFYGAMGLWFASSDGDLMETLLEPSTSGILSLGGFFVNWLYFALMESSEYQGTLGKKALGLKVTDEFGRRISFGRATGRTFAKILSGLLLCIGYIMVAFSDKKQGLHDRIASTLVIYASSVVNQTPVYNAPIESSSPLVYTTNRQPSSKKLVMFGFDSDGRTVRVSFDTEDHRLFEGGIQIGRDGQSAPIYINDTSVSRVHAKIYHHDGALWIEDLKSTNGTVLNGKKLTAGTAERFPDRGDLVIGDVQLTIGES